METKAKKFSLICICAIIALLFIVISYISLSNAVFAQAESYVCFEQKIYSELDVDSDFDGRDILVVMDKYVSDVNKLHNGKFDTAPILFIDKEAAEEYEVINLYFSDGTCVKVIDEHGFWDYNLNKYVFLRKDAH